MVDVDIARRVATRLLIALGALAMILGVAAVAPSDPATNPTVAVASADPATNPPPASSGDDANEGGQENTDSGGGLCDAKKMLVLPFLAPGCLAKKGAGAVKDAAGEGFKAVAKSLAQAWLKTIQLCLAWFIKIPTPQFGTDPVIQKIQQSTVTIQLYGLVLSLILGGFRLVMARRNAAIGAAQESFMALAKTVFGAWMFGAVLVAGSAGTDALANWLLEQGSTPEIAQGLLNNLGTAGIMGMGSGLVFVVAIVGILGGILQAVLLVGRQAMLVVVVTVAPIAGAFGGTQAGRSAFSKLISWTVALMLWKPVAALVYWIAFAMAGHDVKTAKDAQMAFYGFILISLTAFVMPMLIKLVTGGAAMAAGSGLSAAMTTAGVVAAAGTIAATGGAGAAGAGAGAGSAGVGASTSTAGSAGAGPGFSGGGAPSGGGSPSTGGGTGGSSGGGPSGGGSPSTGGGTGGPSSGGPHGGSGSDGAGAIPAGGGHGSSDDGGGASSLPSSGGGTGGGFDPGMAMQGLQTVSAATDSFFNDESYGAAEGGDVR